MRVRALAAAALATGVACNDSVEPPPLVDPPPTPYLVSPRGVRVNGVTRMLVIPTRLAGGAAPTISPQQMHADWFGSRDQGIVSRAYGLASGGKFALRGEVTSWVQSSVTRVALNFDTLVVQAITIADQFVDFGRYDSDGPDGLPNSGDDDGIVDGGVAIVIPELDQGCPGPGIHPFARTSWGTGTTLPRPPVPTADSAAGGGTIGINGFTVMSATDCAGGRANTPMAHELGHILFGLPDLYHQADVSVPANERWRGRRWVVGCWELMAAGSGWGCGAGAPTAPRFHVTFGAWARTAIGWVTPTEIPADVAATYELWALDRGGTALSIPLGPQERILIEYRQRVAGDAALPGDGVLLYHVVDTLTQRPDTAGPRRYQVMLVEADGDNALVRITAEGGNRGAASDAFGMSVTGFSPETHAAAKRADGTPLPFALENITFDVARGRATFRLRPLPND